MTGYAAPLFFFSLFCPPFDNNRHQQENDLCWDTKLHGNWTPSSHTNNPSNSCPYSWLAQCFGPSDHHQFWYVPSSSFPGSTISSKNSFFNIYGKWNLKKLPARHCYKIWWCPRNANPMAWLHQHMTNQWKLGPCYISQHRWSRWHSLLFCIHYQQQYSTRSYGACRDHDNAFPLSQQLSTTQFQVWLLGCFIVNSIMDNFYVTLIRHIPDGLIHDGPYLIWSTCHKVHYNATSFVPKMKK